MAAGQLSTQVRRFPPSRVEEGARSTPWEETGSTRTTTVTKRWYPHCSEIDCYWTNARKFWGSRSVNVTKKVVSMLSGGKPLLGNCEGASRGRNLVFVRLYFALPRRCPTCCEILDPLRIARIEGGGCISEYELAFPEMA